MTRCFKCGATLIEACPNALKELEEKLAGKQNVIDCLERLGILVRKDPEEGIIGWIIRTTQ